MFIFEYITFKCSVTSQGTTVTLWKLGRSFTDRRDPDKILPKEVYAPKDFGTITFDSADIQAIYTRLYEGTK